MNNIHYAMITCVVQPEDDGERLDKFLTKHCAGFTRTRLAQLIKDGCVQGPCQNPSGKVRAGQSYDVTPPAAIDATPQAQDIPLNVIFEDDDVLVIDKPVGLVVHPGAGHADNTLVNALLAHCGKSLSGIGGVRRPGIVHRLDKDTSGLMVVAKNDTSHQALSTQLSRRTMQRTYHAFVWGAVSPSRGVIEGAIGRHPTHRQKMALRAETGKPAITHYTVLRTYGTPPLASLVECRLETGRTHQIRVHMSHRKHPLIGDALYSRSLSLGPSTPWLIRLREWERRHARQALHACELRFRHPRTGDEHSFSSPLPNDLQALEALLTAPMP